MLNIEKEREALVAEIELFIAEAMKAYVVERWADSYQNTEPFAYTINAKNEVWWMKTQAHQLWQFWKSAKVHEAQKLEGCVVVPVELNESIAEKLALEKVEKPRHENDVVWQEIADRAYKDGLIQKKWEIIRNYKELVEAARGGK